MRLGNLKRDPIFNRRVVLHDNDGTCVALFLTDRFLFRGRGHYGGWRQMNLCAL